MLYGNRARWGAALLFSAIAAVAAGLAAVLAGSHNLDLARAMKGLPPDRDILVQVRLPRALLALWTGGALSLSGVLFQALMRNPLATPDTLGVSSGAALGAVIAIFFGWSTGGAISGVSIAACAGAAVVLVLVVIVASFRGSVSPIGLLLSGVTINVMCGAAIVFISSMVGFLKSFAVAHWLMGGLDAPEYSTLLWLTVVLTPVCHGHVLVWPRMGSAGGRRHLGGNPGPLHHSPAGHRMRGRVAADRRRLGAHRPLCLRRFDRSTRAAHVAGRRSSHPRTLFVPSGRGIRRAVRYFFADYPGSRGNTRRRDYGAAGRSVFHLDAAEQTGRCPAVILVGGGSRSGKSSAALRMLRADGPRQGFIATAQVWDDEMRERIRVHRTERGPDITTWEEPFDVAARLAAEDDRYDAIVVDCLTLWLSNVMLAEDRDVAEECSRLVEVAGNAKTQVILVTNEVGCGIVPDNALARRFRDEAGRVGRSRWPRSCASEVHWMIFGTGLRIK